MASGGASISLNPSSGRCGTTVHVIGHGWIAYDYVHIYSNLEGQTNQANPDINGYFDIPISVPTGITNPYIITAFSYTDLSSSTKTFTISGEPPPTTTPPPTTAPPPTTTTEPASMNISPGSGPPGTTIAITGIGFGPTNTAVTLTSTWGSSTSTVTTSSSGNFSALIVVPTVTPQTYEITATSGSGSATRIFTVTPLSTFILSAYSGFVGDSVSIIGTGFSPGTDVSIFMDSSPAVLASLTPTASGTLNGTITIPASSRGNHAISTSVSGVPIQLFAVNSRIILNPVAGGVGDIVTVTGSGFNAGPVNNVTISWDSSDLTTSPATVNTDANGTFSCIFTVPSVTQGSHTVKAADSGGNATAAFSIVPKITLTPPNGVFGDKVVISGSGFSGNQPIALTIDGNPIAVTPSPLTSGANGSIDNVSFDIPAIAGGIHTVRASDQDGHFCEATLTVSPKISVTPASGTVGTQITVTGNGFVPGAVSLTWDNAAFDSPISTIASNTGVINVTFVAPASAKIPSPGHVITASDTAGNQSSGNFIILPKIMLSSSAGTYGDTITCTLTGFTPNTVISTSLISGDTTRVIETNPATVQTDANGNATATFILPEVYNGNWTVQASDGVETSAKATLAVGQKLTLDTDTGAAGDTVTAKGTGFSANTVITLTYKGIVLDTIPSGISSDTNGSFTCQFIVPPTTSGTLIVAASDGFSVSTLNFTAIAKATINKATTELNQGFVGMEITISGTGFEPNALVTLSSESETITQVYTDDNGCFTASFKFPIALSGPHTITAYDGTTTKDFAFFMDSIAPEAPQLVLPSDKLKPKQPVPFNWQGVTDPSGVIYTLQISQDPDFGTLVLEKTGLTAESYTMAATEQLKRAGSKTPYYWRVRATDQAGNVGPWSVAYTFTIGLILPSWMIYVWIGLGILAAFFFGLWIGHRGVYARYLYQ